MRREQAKHAHERASELGIHTRNGDGTLLDADDLARRWKVPRTWIYRASRSGALPSVRLGRYVRFRSVDVERFEQEGGTS